MHELPAYPDLDLDLQELPAVNEFPNQVESLPLELSRAQAPNSRHHLFSSSTFEPGTLMAETPIVHPFKSVQVLKDQSLGIGSYGAVCKAKCDDLLCAAKIIHPTLFAPTALQRIAPQREHRLPIRRFEQECEFMSTIRHPNVVQYLGMFRDTDTHLPVLLMELMDNSLTHFLESSTQPIPYYIQVNFCHDISLALSFLHSKNIIHRDLSSNNVLLIGNVRAKVTDFGMARLGDVNPQATRFTNTMCPGTDVYMPPEAVQDKPVYTEKIDCFSFGVITVQIVTRQFPNPGDRLQEVPFKHPGLPAGTVCIRVLEVNRRQIHISEIPPNHPLLPIALDCLKDKDGERPSAHQLCERVGGLKKMSDYRDSARALPVHTVTPKVKECEIQQIIQQERDQARMRERESNLQLRQLQQERDQALRKNDLQQQEKESLLGQVNQQRKANEHVVAQFERRIAELEQQLSQREQQKTQVSSRGNELTSLKLRWREGKRIPSRMSRWCDAVVEGDTVYVMDGGSVQIFAYDITSNNWSHLPDCTWGNGAITVINGWLTTVGGSSYSSYFNELFSLIGEDGGKRWTKKFPPMPTKRKWITVRCTGTTLIVAGGWGEGDRVLSTVEVMDTETHQWFTAADLPEPTYQASATVCGDQLYVLGRRDKDRAFIKSVYTCSVSALLLSCIPSSFKKTTLKYKSGAWRQVADLPLIQSTCESFRGLLLATGGKMDSAGKPTAAIYVYNSTTNCWKIISHMTTGRYDCLTAVLPDNRLMIMGGVTDDGFTDTVEIAD